MTDEKIKAARENVERELARYRVHYFDATSALDRMVKSLRAELDEIEGPTGFGAARLGELEAAFEMGRLAGEAGSSEPYGATNPFSVLKDLEEFGEASDEDSDE